MLNPRKSQIQGVLKNEIWINNSAIIVKEFKISSNIIKGECLHKNGQI